MSERQGSHIRAVRKGSQPPARHNAARRNILLYGGTFAPMMSKLVLSDSHDSHWYSPTRGAAAAIAAALSSVAG